MVAILPTLWASLAPIHANIYGLIFTLFGAWLLYMFRAKVKLIYGRANNSLNHFTSPNPDDPTNERIIDFYVEKYFVQNIGRKPATDVEFVLSEFPGHIAIFEPRESELKSIGQGECLVKIPNIAPYELVVIDCAYVNQRAAWVVSVKCAEAMGKPVNFWTVRRFSNSVNNSILFLMLLGGAFIVQAVIALIVGS